MLSALLPRRKQRYRLLRKIAEGGTAEVFLADGPRGHVAIKRLYPELCGDPFAVSAFVREAEISSYIKHPDVVSVHTIGRTRDGFALVVEYVEGPRLLAVLEQLLEQGRVFPLRMLARVFLRIADAVSAVHNARDDKGRQLGVIHRDLTPSNIILSRNGQCRLLDFGVAKISAAADTRKTTKTGTARGSIAYLAPERITGDPVDQRCDVYSLGIILYEMLSGYNPFEDDTDLEIFGRILRDPVRTPSWVRRDLELSSGDQRAAQQCMSALDPLVLSALSRDPRQRPASVEVFARHLRQVLSQHQQGEANETELVAWLAQFVDPPLEEGECDEVLTLTPLSEDRIRQAFR